MSSVFDVFFVSDNNTKNGPEAFLEGFNIHIRASDYESAQKFFEEKLKLFALVDTIRNNVPTVLDQNRTEPFVQTGIQVQDYMNTLFDCIQLKNMNENLYIVYDILQKKGKINVLKTSPEKSDTCDSISDAIENIKFDMQEAIINYYITGIINEISVGSSNADLELLDLDKERKTLIGMSIEDLQTKMNTLGL